MLSLSSTSLALYAPVSVLKFTVNNYNTPFKHSIRTSGENCEKHFAIIYVKGGDSIRKNTDKNLKKATGEIVDMICREVSRVRKKDEFDAKEIKELTSAIKELTALTKAYSEENASSELRVIFEGGESTWAK